tara:strand:+ start:1722 stop:3089 length:1368 start_codon:yes stop_codon:yes gene_type:complete
MAQLFHGDCLEEMKQLDDDSVDLIFCDLPYGQTSCKWDCKIDLEKFWVDIMRVKKLHTPIFFTTTTKFGVELIQSAPKKCYFRYDLVWVKSAPAGFLSAKKMPMRKHEMIYVFYEKLPFYDLSSHKHKFIQSGDKEPEQVIKGNKKKDELCYGIQGDHIKERKNGEPRYDPPLPVSVVKEPETEVEVNEKYTYKQDKEKDLYGTDIRKEVRTGKDVGKSSIYDPPLPVSVVKEDMYIYGKEGEAKEDVYNHDERLKNGKLYHHPRKLQKGSDPIYDPPLPVSVVKEPEPEPECSIVKRTDKGCDALYGKETGKIFIYDKDGKLRNSEPRYDPPLPVSVVKEETEDYQTCDKPERKTMYGNMKIFEPKRRSEPRYDPPLPTSMLEVKSTRGKHSTEKPVALMEWVLKYYSKEGDVVLDPTMGSGSTGVACRNMNRDFIGIEMDDEIYEVACNRVYN